MKHYLGCDPGWTNLAWAILSEEGDLKTGVMSPKDIKGIGTPLVIEENLDDHDIGGAVMERFVYYDGVHNPNSEHILMITGQIQFYLSDYYKVVPTMIKAFDWKSRLSKHIFKMGFENPSDRLDKEFSVAAAEFLFPEYDFRTDHEADAACMAYIARLLDR
jgi:hypothetical protein